jgi:hypothetical protein
LSKPDVKNLSHILCFNCCAIFTANKSSDIECPECGYCPNPDVYSKIMNYGIAAAYYGRDYRERYEKQLAKKGEIKERYALPDPATILCFLAVAALSGVIGGLSHDIVKSAFRKIIGNANKSQDDIGQTKINFINDNDINIFIQQVNTFHLDFKDIDSSVKSEIKKEIIIWELTDAIKSEVKDNKFTKDDIYKAIKKGFEQAEHPRKPSKEDFAEFWKKIEGEDS